LSPWNRFKYDQRFPFAALLGRDQNGRTIWIRNPQSLPRPINRISLRINDNDRSFGDNRGALRVCLTGTR
jgi:hypothetical protein